MLAEPAMYRRCGLALGIAFLAWALSAPRASAGVTIDLLFVARNGSPIAPTSTVGANPGDELLMNLVMKTTSQLSIHAFSLNYDLISSTSSPPARRATGPAWR